MGSPNQSPAIRAKRSFQDAGYSSLHALCSRKGAGDRKLESKSVLTDGLWCPSEEQTTTTR